MPYHIRILTEEKGEYRLRPELPPGEDLPMDEYLAHELDNGYVLETISNIPSIMDGPHQVRVLTKHNPQLAARHPARRGQREPWHYRIFFENQYQYWTEESKGGPPLSLDQYLAREAAKGYELKSLVGIQPKEAPKAPRAPEAPEDRKDGDRDDNHREDYFKPKLRVSTQYGGLPEP